MCLFMAGWRGHVVPLHGSGCTSGCGIGKGGQEDQLEWGWELSPLSWAPGSAPAWHVGLRGALQVAHGSAGRHCHQALVTRPRGEVGSVLDTQMSQP